MAKQKIDPQYVDQLIQYIGGRANISTVTHCITRLRFVLNDESKIDTAGIESLPVSGGDWSGSGRLLQNPARENWFGERG